MATITTLQTSFNRGQLDPRLTGRKDLQAYYAGGRQMKNVTTLVQGGVTRRNGSEHIHTGEGNGRTFNFSFSTEVNYCLLFTPLKIEIFKKGVLQTNINGSGNDFLVTTFDLDHILDMSYIQSADTIILTHAESLPTLLQRLSDTSWNFTAPPFVFDKNPMFDFDDALSPTPVDEIQDILFANENEGDRYKIGLEGLLTDEILFGGDQATNITNIQTALIDLPNTGNLGSITVTSTTILNYKVTFSDSSAKAWDLMTFTPIFSEESAPGLRILATRSQAGTSRQELQWSVTRGFPTLATFHEGRLWFANSTFRPQTLWGSKVNEFFNFDKAKARDDEGIEVTLDTNEVNAITGIFSNRNLQVFTTGGAFYVPQSPITPSNISLPRQTNFGAKKVQPVTIDGTTLYVQRTGKAVRDFVFVDGPKAYNSNSISVLATVLINDPVALLTAQGSSDSDADYVYIINSDGSMAVYNSLTAEDVNGLTEWETDGDIVSGAVVDDLLYLYVLRNGSFFLERENVSITTDSSSIAALTNTITGLGHLEGREVDVVADNAYQGKHTVSGGQVVLDEIFFIAWAGLNYTPIIETMPLNVNLPRGPTALKKKRIVEFGVELLDSVGVIVNGVRIPNKTMGVNVFEFPIPITGLRTGRPLGYSLEATLIITQSEPLPMTILSAYIEVSV